MRSAIVCGLVLVFASAVSACQGKQRLIETVVASDPLALSGDQRERLEALFDGARADLVADHLRGPGHEHIEVLGRFALAVHALLTPEQRAAQERRRAERLTKLRQGARELGDALATLRRLVPVPPPAPRPASSLEARVDALLAELEAGVARLEAGQDELRRVDVGPAPVPRPSSADLRRARGNRAARRARETLGPLWRAVRRGDQRGVRSGFLAARRLGLELIEDKVFEARQQGERVLRSSRLAAMQAGALAAELERLDPANAKLLLRGHPSPFRLLPGYADGARRRGEAHSLYEGSSVLVFFGDGKIGGEVILVASDLGRVVSK